MFSRLLLRVIGPLRLDHIELVLDLLYVLGSVLVLAHRYRAAIVMLTLFHAANVLYLLARLGWQRAQALYATAAQAVGLHDTDDVRALGNPNRLTGAR